MRARWSVGGGAQFRQLLVSAGVVAPVVDVPLFAPAGPFAGFPTESPAQCSVAPSYYSLYRALEVTHFTIESQFAKDMTLTTVLVYQQICSDCRAFAPNFFEKLPKNIISRNYIKLRIRGSPAPKNSCHYEVNMNSSVAKHYGCKRARHCGLIGNGHSQANRDFPCARHMNRCFARYTAIMSSTQVLLPWRVFNDRRNRTVGPTDYLDCWGRLLWRALVTSDFLRRTFPVSRSLLG